MESIVEEAAVSGTVRNIASLLRGFSLEATAPKQNELDAIHGVLAPGTRIYLSCPPAHSARRLIEQAKAVRVAGFEPVPHITARTYPSIESANEVLSGLAGEADVRHLLVIAGDCETSAGPFADARALIESGLLQRNNIQEIGISGYADGHPKISDALLAQALAEKLEAVKKSGLDVYIATQFCFDGKRILQWLRTLRLSGMDAPVRVGLAGPAGVRALLRYALRCGVRASLQGMLNPKAMQLLGEAAPDGIIRTLSEAEDLSVLGPLAIHFFSFGGLSNTANWVAAAAAGQIDPKPGGFRICD